MNMNSVNIPKHKIRNVQQIQPVIEEEYVSPHIKRQLINHIYTTVDLSTLKYKMLEYENDLILLTKQKYYVSANFAGSNCLLIFMRTNGNYYSYLVDRKTLSYNASQISLEAVKVYPVNIRLDGDIYDGSIFDGILIQHNNNTKAKTFIITDVYTFRGKNTLNEKIQYKLANIVVYLEKFIKETNPNFTLTINNLYDITKIHELLEITKKMKSHIIKGLSFYPELSETKLIYMFDNDVRNVVTNRQPMQNVHKLPININDIAISSINNLNNTNNTNSINNIGNVTNSIHNINSLNGINSMSSINSIPNMNNTNNIHNEDNTNSSQNENIKLDKVDKTTKQLNIQKKVSYRYICKSSDPVYATFELKKTENADVYKLYLVENITRDGKTILKTKNMGIAYVPSIECSTKCRDAFNEVGLGGPNNRVLMKCRYVDTLGKWEPVQKNVNAKYADNIDNLHQYLDVIEESLSEDEPE